MDAVVDKCRRTVAGATVRLRIDGGGWVWLSTTVGSSAGGQPGQSGIRRWQFHNIHFRVGLVGANSVECFG